jgi:hypothetical protein
MEIGRVLDAGEALALSIIGVWRCLSVFDVSR